MIRKTKLIATIGPASEDEATLRKLMLAGLNVARLNFSHGSYHDHAKKIDLVRKLNIDIDKEVGIMLDTKGPEIRTHLFKGGQAYIEKNSEIKIYMKERLGDHEAFSINYPELVNDVSIGTTILIDDGYLQTLVIDIDKEEGYILVVAKNSHLIKDRRGINIPNTKLNLPFVSRKDYEDINFGNEKQVDYIAASFTRKKEDVLEIKEILKTLGNDHIQIIAKIENQEGVDNIDEILSVADGIMVARGDLGVEMFPEDIPKIQKELITKSQKLGKIVIVATQMLESMQKNPRPTRAEVSDVANAIYEGADAIMLSGETASGLYPVESLELMNRIALRTEKEVDYKKLIDHIQPDQDNLLLDMSAFATSHITLRYDIKAVMTSSICQANQISKYRLNCPIYVILDDHKKAHQFSLYYGVYAFVPEDKEHIDYTKLNIFPQDLVIRLDEQGLKIIEV